MKRITIAIDGPAASGKSTVAKVVANKLNYIYIDSGAMYRALTLKALRNKIDVYNEEELVKMTLDSKIELTGSKIYLDGEDVSRAIRGIRVTNNVSAVSSHYGVRKLMVDMQKEYGKLGGIVMDGRDIGTAVFPKAELKIFQVASVETRALRRYEENVQKGIECNLEELKAEIEARDYKDSHRKVSPLCKAEDALTIDTSSLSVEEVINTIIKLAEERIGD